MNKIGNILSTCALLMHSEKEKSGLDYLSRIDGEEAAWYFWMNACKGVHELKMVSQSNDGDEEKSVFLLKYYPDIEEAVFDEFSCLEQFTRLGDCFEQGNVEIPENVDVCPCCGGKVENHHEHHSCHNHHHITHKERFKGIPKLISRQEIPIGLFSIAKITIIVSGDAVSKVYLETQDYYKEYAEDGIKIHDKDGMEHVLVASGEIDRNVPGYELSKVFYSFFINKMLLSMSMTLDKCSEEVLPGVLIFYYNNQTSDVRTTSEVKKIILSNY